MSRALIGIDVGWSTKRASCGVAVRGGNLLLPYAHTYGTRMQAGRYTLPALLEVIGTWRSRNAQALKDAIVVLDGPLGPAGRPTRDRHVDSACSREEFCKYSPEPVVTKAQRREHVRRHQGGGSDGHEGAGGKVPAAGT
jgi:predicted RNase H-like nuclease